MKASVKNRIKGTAKEAKGRIKQTAGHATRNRRLARKGAAEATAGRFRQKVGDLEEDLERVSKD